LRSHPTCEARILAVGRARPRAEPP
jgi:hypothetical protein